VSAPAGVSLRPMRWWDIDPALGLERELFADDPWTARGFWSELAGIPVTRHYVIAEDPDGTLLGYAGLAAAAGQADVQTVAVRTDRQGAGLGRTLVGSLLAAAVERGCTEVFLEVAEDNTSARRLYDRFGFERVGVRRGYYGPGRDALVLRLRLAGR